MISILGGVVLLVALYGLATTEQYVALSIVALVLLVWGGGKE
jgi:hypothetical protein